MIDSIYLENFKCFKTQRIPLSNLTLVTGGNAAGKSTSIQSMLLITQWARNYKASDYLPLNGSLVRLGSAGDVLNEHASDHSIKLNFFSSDSSLKLDLDSGDRQSNGIKFTHTEEALHGSILKQLENLIFLGASRLGTDELFPSPESPEPIHANVGTHGEFAPWWFFKHIDSDVDRDRCSAGDEAITLRRQVNAWGASMFPGFEANASQIRHSAHVQLELRTSQNQGWKKPSNIGYGLSYAFPILVAGLLAERGQLLIVDSPEAHLHPKGQSKMGEFLARMASSGVQIVVETHSDHFLNGVRLALSQQAISPEEVSVLFFSDMPDTDSQPAVRSPMVDKRGNLSEWPENFFDQAEKDMSKIMGWDESPE